MSFQVQAAKEPLKTDPLQSRILRSVSNEIPRDGLCLNYVTISHDANGVDAVVSVV